LNTKDHVKPVTLFLAFFLLAGCGGSTPSKNFVLITIDTTRADKIGCYGGNKDVTPVLDAIAAKGVRFEKAYACVPITLPSHASILTGLYPHEHGVHDNGLFRLSDDQITVAEVLRDAGVSTAAFISSWVLEHQFGLNQGFDTYGGLVRQMEKPGGTIPERPAFEVSQSSIQWLLGAEEPFFLWIHYFDPHFPYAPPEPFKSRFKGREYEGEIAYADEEIGLVLEALRKKGCFDTTFVMVTSDHGEGLGERGEMTHGYFVYDSTVSVPLLLMGPEITAGKTISSTVSHVDIAPTVFDLLQVKDSLIRQGTSLLPLIEGNSREEPVYLESELPRISFGFQPVHGISHLGWKLIEAGEIELYAREDRLERENVLNSQRDRARTLSTALKKHQEVRLTSAEFNLSSADRAQRGALGYSAGQANQTVLKEKWKAGELLEIIELRDTTKTHMLQARLEEAEATARSLIERCKESYVGYEFLGTVLARQGEATPKNHPMRLEKYREAKDHLTKALEIQPALVDAHLNLAVCLHFLGDDDGAKRELQKVLELDPGHAQAKFLIDQMEKK
jgi:arylsulfatase A-like enzyme